MAPPRGGGQSRELKGLSRGSSGGQWHGCEGSTRAAHAMHMQRACVWYAHASTRCQHAWTHAACTRDTADACAHRYTLPAHTDLHRHSGTGRRVPGCQRCQGAAVSGCQGAKVLRFQDVGVPGYRGVRVPGCQHARELGCNGVRVLRSPDARASGCQDARELRWQSSRVLGSPNARVPRCEGCRVPGCRSAGG